MPTIREILNEKNRRLVEIPNEFYSSVQKTEQQLYARLLELLDKLKLDASGQAIRSKANLAIAEEITTQLKNTLYSSDYVKALADFSGQFNNQENLNSDYFKKAFPEFTGSELASQLVQVSRKQAVELLTGSAIDNSFFTPIKQALIDAVDMGVSRIDLIKTIQTTVIGDPEKEGKLLSYSKQIAHDSFALSDRSYSNAVAEDLGVEWFFYSGHIIDTSRPFCIERHNSYYHYKQIEAWGDGKDLGKVKNPKTGLWDGAMKGTNSKTIFKTAGGYNCEHSFMAVSISDVPKTVVNRAIKDGYYKP
jgi:hypothetical protein